LQLLDSVDVEQALRHGLIIGISAEHRRLARQSVLAVIVSVSNSENRATSAAGKSQHKKMLSKLT
jgi:hypothetical protein